MRSALLLVELGLLVLLLGYPQHASSGSVEVADFLSLFRNESDPYIDQRSVYTSKFSDIYYPPESPTFCAGAGYYDNQFIKEGDAPHEFCTWSPYKKAGLFNQFLAEFVMLRSWTKSIWTPSSGADVVVIPSYLHHYIWKYRDTKMWDILKQAAWNKESIGLYWKELMAKYYHPERKYTPWIVIHYGYAWDAWNRHFLYSLVDQPNGFVERVIILSLDGSNLSLKQKLHIHSVSPKATPTLLALPYTTGVLRTVDWSKSTSSYDSNRVRPFHILFDGLWQNLRRQSSVRAWIKKQGQQHREDMHLRIAKKRTLLAPKVDYPDRAKQNTRIREYKLWDLAVNTDFCFEPDGDTPTRSHFYVAVQAGCIPVLFDHAGGGNFSATLKTDWPFRTTASPYQLEYEKFSVVYDAREVVGGRVDVFKELMEMPTTQPERFQALRRELVVASKWLTYTFPEVLELSSDSQWDSGGGGSGGGEGLVGWREFTRDRTVSQRKGACPVPGVCDAFTAIQGVLDTIIT